MIFDTVDVHFLREERQHAVTPGAFDNASATLFRASKTLELQLVNRSAITFVVSRHEHLVLSQLLPTARLRVLSNIYRPENIDAVPTYEMRSGAVFVGNMCHTPNQDAVKFITDEILGSDTAPSFPAGFTVHLVLSRLQYCVNAEIMNAASKHPMIKVHKDVSNAALKALHDSVLVVLAPLRFGAGVKGKVNYGLNNGVPVIGTTVAFEGMNLVDRKNVYVANSGRAFQDGIMHLCKDKALWKRLQVEGVAAMRKGFGVEVAAKESLTGLTC